MLDLCVNCADTKPAQVLARRDGESSESWQKLLISIRQAIYEITTQKANDDGDLLAHPVSDRHADRLKGGAQHRMPQHSMSRVYRPQPNGTSYNGNFVNSDIFAGVSRPTPAYNSQWAMPPNSYHPYCPRQVSMQQYYTQAPQYPHQPHLSLPGYGLPLQGDAQQWLPQQYDDSQRIEIAKGVIPEWALSTEYAACPIPESAKQQQQQQAKKSSIKNRQYSGFASENDNFQKKDMQTAAQTENTNKETASATHSLNRNESATDFDKDLQEFEQRSQHVPLYRKVSRTKEQLKEQVRELQQRLREKEVSGRRFKFKEKARRLIDLNSYSPSTVENKFWSPTPRGTPNIGSPKSPTARTSILRPQASTSYSRHRPYTYPTRTSCANDSEKYRVWSDYSPVRWTPIDGARYMGFRAYVPKPTTSKFVVNEATSPITSAIFSDLLQQKGRRSSNSSSHRRRRRRSSPYENENPQEKSQSKKNNSKAAKSPRTSKSKLKLKKTKLPTAPGRNINSSNFVNSYDHLWYVKRLPPPLHAHHASAVPPQNRRQVYYVDRKNFLPPNSSAKSSKFN